MIEGRVCWFSGEHPDGGPSEMHAWGTRGETEGSFQEDVECVVMVQSAENYWVERYKIERRGVAHNEDEDEEQDLMELLA